MRPDFLQAGEEARLFPVLSDNSREGRALSILLATMRFVPLFASTLLAELGHKMRTRSRLRTYTEVVLTQEVEKHGGLRPDGLLVVGMSKRLQWCALVEAKVRGAKLDNDQINAYLDLAKANGVNTVATISNDFAPRPNHHPTYVGRVPSGVSLVHVSWTSILTHARLMLANDMFEDADHKLLIDELVRFLDHTSTGVRSFDHMPASWKGLTASVMAGATPHRTSDAVKDAVASWHQETRDLALQLTQLVNAHVGIKMSRKHRDEPKKRINDDATELCESACLTAEFSIPSAAAPIAVEADLRRRTITVSMKMDAPQDRVSTRARVNWLLRQLRKSDPNSVHIVGHWPHHPPVQAMLVDARDNPSVMDRPTGKGNGTPVKAFTVMLVRDAAGRFAGSRTFIAELEDAMPRFYEHVGQRLKAWQPAAPQVKLPPPSDVTDVNESSVDGEETDSTLAE